MTDDGVLSSPLGVGERAGPSALGEYIPQSGSGGAVHSAQVDAHGVTAGHEHVAAAISRAIRTRDNDGKVAGEGGRRVIEVPRRGPGNSARKTAADGARTVVEIPPRGHLRKGRRRLWEIAALYHCSIIGTCLSLGELRRILAAQRVHPPAEHTEHQIHAHFVRAAAEPTPITRAVQKMLDRKFRSAVRRFSALRAESAIRSLWEACVAQGDIPGPYWAVMTHPKAPAGLISRAFDDVHMLSHLMGASNRGELRRLAATERRTAELEEWVATLRGRLAEQRAENQKLGGRLSAMATLEGRLRIAENAVERFENGDQVRTLENRVDVLARDLEYAIRRAEKAEQRAAALERERDEFRGSVVKLSDYREQFDRLEAELRTRANGRAGHACDAQRPAETPLDLQSLDLGDRTILYVGGRSRLIAHFRSLVEQSNGRFIHHDGGLEENLRRLHQILGQGDAVLCPVSCVSHLAVQNAKKFCKQADKPLVFLRSPGLSSFVRGLRALAVERSETGQNPQ